MIISFIIFVLLMIGIWVLSMAGKKGPTQNKTEEVIFEDKDEEDDRSSHYRRKNFLMNIPERRFFEKLKEIVPEGYIIFPQVALSAIIYVVAPRYRNYKYRNKIDRKVLDFVIFELPYYKPVVAIEYDGRTHQRPDRVRRDIDMQQILDASKISNFHVQHGENIPYEEVKKAIDGFLAKKVN